MHDRMRCENDERRDYQKYDVIYICTLRPKHFVHLNVIMLASYRRLNTRLMYVADPLSKLPVHAVLKFTCFSIHYFATMSVWFSYEKRAPVSGIVPYKGFELWGLPIHLCHSSQTACQAALNSYGNGMKLMKFVDSGGGLAFFATSTHTTCCRSFFLLMQHRVIHKRRNETQTKKREKLG
jgi:hypothetical protein